MGCGGCSRGAWEPRHLGSLPGLGERWDLVDQRKGLETRDYWVGVTSGKWGLGGNLPGPLGSPEWSGNFWVHGERGWRRGWEPGPLGSASSSRLGSAVRLGGRMPASFPFLPPPRMPASLPSSPSLSDCLGPYRPPPCLGPLGSFPGQ